MSSDGVEGLLFSMQSSPDLVARFRASPGSMLAEYPLTAQERSDLEGWNVRALSDRGVNDMLLMVAFISVNGVEATPEYMQRMNTPAKAPAKLALV